MAISSWYQQYAVRNISGRYLHLDHVNPVLRSLRKKALLTQLGTSELGQTIPLVTLGNGETKIMAWSQMHGNESTTTKALLDLMVFLTSENDWKEPVEHFLASHTLYCIPILNPDGAQRYTRENANGIDLNRDAQDLSQAESKLLRSVFDSVQPHLCLNLHDQRSIYGLDSGQPAAISFLSPAANAQRHITQARAVAMEHIVRVARALHVHAPYLIGRYDDSYNPNCVGDTFQAQGVPTILFEAGHRQQDYQREYSRELVFYAFLSLFGITGKAAHTTYPEAYLDIPENRKNFRDILVKNVRIAEFDAPVNLAIQYQEVLEGGQIRFRPVLDDFGPLTGLHGHREIAGHGSVILLNSQEKLYCGEIISEITDKQGVSIVNFK